MRASAVRRDPSSSLDTIAVYLESIRRYPLLSRDEEGALARRLRAGDQGALDTLVCANLRFVVSVAKRYQNQGVSLLDLVNEGNLGLIRAAHRFDETKGIRFISYAVWWIRQAIVQALADQGRIVRVPMNRAGQLHRIGRRASALLQELGREPTHEEIAEGMDLSEEEVHQTLTLVRPTLSLEGPTAVGADGCLADLLADDRAEAPDDAFITEALRDHVRAALGVLRPREARILRLYFGFDDEEPMTLEQIGALLGITRERVRQIKEKALSRLRHGSRARALATWTS